MTLTQLLNDARVSLEISEPLGSLEVKQSERVCPISFYPWLKSDTFAKAIAKLEKSNCNSSAFISFDRQGSVYCVTLEKKESWKKMESTRLELVYMTSDEIADAKKVGKNVVLIPASLKKELGDTFYGGYSSGTAPMGYAPNAIILKE